MAATYDFTPVNGGAKTVGTLESYVQLKMFKITIKDTSTAVDLRGVDGAYGSEYELIIRDLQPLMVWAPNDTSGVINVVMDGHAVDATSLQLRVRALAAGLGLGGTASTNVSTVQDAISFAVTTA